MTGECVLSWWRMRKLGATSFLEYARKLEGDGYLEGVIDDLEKEAAGKESELGSDGFTAFKEESRDLRIRLQGQIAPHLMPLSATVKSTQKAITAQYKAFMEERKCTFRELNQYYKNVKK